MLTSRRVGRARHFRRTRSAMLEAALILDNYQPTAPPPVPKHGEKGLQNYIGENNCFLNVNIQALWHLRVWREQLLAYEKDHTHSDPETCVFCSLKVWHLLRCPR